MEETNVWLISVIVVCFLIGFWIHNNYQRDLVALKNGYVHVNYYGFVKIAPNQQED